MMRPARRRPRPYVKIAFTRVAESQVLVVDVAPWVVCDPFEAELAIAAIQLSYGYEVVLHATEPCGCRLFYGLPELVLALETRAPEALVWQLFTLDFSRRARA